MLDYIKAQLRERGAQINESKQQKNAYKIEEDPVVLTEYAHVIQELDELTVDGTEANQLRKISSIIDIPMEEDDDLEIDTIEMNLNDGRITDIPMDATVTESMDYQLMKTFEDFYQEAMISTNQLPRESNASFRERVTRKAEKSFNQYKNDAAKKELYGSNKIHINNPEVPSSSVFDFGKIKMKLPIAYETDGNYHITRKQLDSLNYAKSNNVFQYITEPLFDKIKRKMNIPPKATLWDIITPKNIMLSKGPADKFCFVMEYTYDQTKESDYFGWSASVSNRINDIIITESAEEEILGNFAHYETKESYLKYEADRKEEQRNRLESKMMNRFGKKSFNIYQEAIDFGNTQDVSSDAGSDLPPDPNQSTATDTSVDTSGDPSVDTSGTTNPEEDGNNANNVSDQIAQKVSDQTQNNENTVSNSTETDTENPTEDMNFDDADFDMSADNPEESDAAINDKLAELDQDLSDEGGTELTEIGDDETSADYSSMNPEDIENMSIEEIVAQGSEKLKSMTLSELRQFLSNDTGAIQEAFVQEGTNGIIAGLVLNIPRITKFTKNAINYANTSTDSKGEKIATIGIGGLIAAGLIAIDTKITDYADQRLREKKIEYYIAKDINNILNIYQSALPAGNSNDKYAIRLGIKDKQKLLMNLKNLEKDCQSALRVKGTLYSKKISSALQDLQNKSSKYIKAIKSRKSINDEDIEKIVAEHLVSMNVMAKYIRQMQNLDQK